MAGIFSRYRSAHHPDTDLRLPLASAFLKGELDGLQAQEVLRRRDRLLRLEVESSTLAGILVKPLADACPTKRFVLTIRDVYSWCDSWIDHNINSPPVAGSPWVALDRLRLRAGEVAPNRFDAPLTALGFPPLACFFSLWARHNGEVLDAVSPDRLLVVRTHELTARLPDIATWAGVPLETLRTDSAWLFRTVEPHRVLARLDAAYVRETADQYCGVLMAEYFADAVWDPGGSDHWNAGG
jgi:Sulfotransferase domain